MKVIQVAPIIRGAFKEKISYFTSQDIREGDVVSVFIRKKKIPALVLEAEDAKKTKSAIKKADFKLKPVKEIIAANFFSPPYIKSAKEIASHFACPFGAVIKETSPQSLLESPEEIKNFSKAKPNSKEEGKFYEMKAIQTTKKERLKIYKSAIREEFAKNRSVFFCLPTINDIEEVSKKIEKGIENYTLIFHSQMGKKKIKEQLQKMAQSEKPLLVIATKSFFSLIRENFGMIVLEEENSPHYKSQHRPYLDARTAAEIIAKNFKLRLIIGDILLRTETYFKLSMEQVPRITSEAEQTFVDMNKEKGSKAVSDFPLLSQPLYEIIKSAKKGEEKIVILVNRRGYSPITLCQDCLQVALCPDCDSPLVLHKKEKNIFICHKCLKEKTYDRCGACQGWRLKQMGIGIQKAEEEIKKLLPGIKIFRMDSDSIKDRKEGEKTAKSFLSTPGSILLGTELLFSYLFEKVENTAVLSIDSLFTLPDFRTNERAFKLLLKLKALASKRFLVQTRLPEQEVFEDALQGKISSFYKRELQARKALGFPPYKLLIKIRKEGKTLPGAKKEINTLRSKFSKWETLAYPAFVPKVRNKYIYNLVIKANPDDWTTDAAEAVQLKKFLSSAYLKYKIDVEPEDLL